MAGAAAPVIAAPGGTKRAAPWPSSAAGPPPDAGGAFIVVPPDAASADVVDAEPSTDGAGSSSRVRVSLQCEAASRPGRVRCEIEARTPPSSTIRWGDVQVLSMPPFATALKGRLSDGDRVAHQEDLWRWAFAVAARIEGHGQLATRVRLVVCDRVCAPVAITAETELRIGREPR